MAERPRVTKYKAKIARNNGAQPYFLLPADRYDHDARQVLAALHKWLRNRKYAPSAMDIVRWKGYNEKACRHYLEDAEMNGMAVCADHRWVLTAAGCEAIGRDFIAPVLPHNISERKKLLGKIKAKADDEKEVDGTFTTFYRQLTGSG